MEWIICVGSNLAIFVIWMLVRGCYKKEDRLIYLNTYEFIETLQEPARSYYLKHSQRMLDQLFLGILLAPWISFILYQVASLPVLMIVMIMYIVIIILYALYQDIRIQRQTKAM